MSFAYEAAQYQPPYPGAKPEEVATLVVNGQEFSDWETVWIQDKWEDTFPEFRFTCAERDPIPDVWTKLQFKPRDQCQILLGRVLAITGIIATRQVAYDANTHGVSLQGVGVTWYAARASITPEQATNIPGGLVQVAKTLLAPTGVELETRGYIPAKPFDPPVHPTPGETIFHVLDKLSRNRKCCMGSTPDGKWLLIGPDNPKVQAQIIEGVNIISAQVVISDLGARDKFEVGAQTAGNDQVNGTDASEQHRTAAGSLDRYSPLYIALEHPVRQADELQYRADFEALWNEGEDITATIVVYGWFDPNGILWKAGAPYKIYSPMAMLNKVLTARTVTFTQDRQSGTRTTLELVQPFRLLQRGYYTSDIATATLKPEVSEVTITPS